MKQWIISVICVILLVKESVGIIWNLQPNTRIDLRETIREVTRFYGREGTSGSDDFKILLVDGDHMLVGAKNMVYNISLSNLQEKDKIEWSSDKVATQICEARMKTKEECQNYIRVIVKKSDDEVFICGTNAFKPWCRTYRMQSDGKLSSFPTSDQSGVGKCPFDPAHNNTALFTAQRLFSGTVTDFAANDAIILGKPIDRNENNPPAVRTEQLNSQLLNEPSFVSSYEFEDKVYFFFRETAVEAINCGKTVYSRVARVCKNDMGGQYILRESWTSFFKSRLNCSLPGDFPFYFDEIQSTSEIGQGNYMPSISMNNKTDMVYAVFNTPQNSIHGSAVCAFRFSDILGTFEGPFKDQKSPHANWLPLPEADTPKPHPAKSCHNDSTDQVLNFVKSHPMMDKAVPAFGGRPLLVEANFDFRLTKIAIDWQVFAADGKHYDVMFIGTTDGRVVKAINKGHEAEHMNTVIIEDIQVFENKAPVVSIQVLRDQGRLVVVSQHEIKSILLERCHLQTTCSDCMALQDPYCSWTSTGLCRKTRSGEHSIDTGTHPMCTDRRTSTEAEAAPPMVPSQAPTCAPCPVCTQRPVQEDNSPLTQSPTERRQTQIPTTELSNEIPQVAEPSTGKISSRTDNLKYGSTDMALAVLFSILISLFCGFVVGYMVHRTRILHRFHRRPDTEEPCNSKQEEKNLRLKQKIHEKTDNRYENPHLHHQHHPHVGHFPHNHSHNNSKEFQPPLFDSLPVDNRVELNVVLNDITGKNSPGKSLNENIETSASPNHKSKKQVYL